jgi:hypothetical protein
LLQENSKFLGTFPVITATVIQPDQQSHELSQRKNKETKQMKKWKNYKGKVKVKLSL